MSGWVARAGNSPGYPGTESGGRPVVICSTSSQVDHFTSRWQTDKITFSSLRTNFFHLYDFSRTVSVLRTLGHYCQQEGNWWSNPLDSLLFYAGLIFLYANAGYNNPTSWWLRHDFQLLWLDCKSGSSQYAVGGQIFTTNTLEPMTENCLPVAVIFFQCFVRCVSITVGFFSGGGLGGVRGSYVRGVWLHGSVVVAQLLQPPARRSTDQSQVFWRLCLAICHSVRAYDQRATSPVINSKEFLDTVLCFARSHPVECLPSFHLQSHSPAGVCRALWCR